LVVLFFYEVHMKRIIIMIFCIFYFLTLIAAAAEPDARKQQEQAVGLARSGRYDEALTVLDALTLSGFQPAAWDEIVVLGWAGRHDQAVALFEKTSTANMPDYVYLSAAGSYYRLNKFKEASGLYHQIAKNGNRQAKRWEAESLMRLGQKEAAAVLYDQLLADNPQDSETYISRGNMRLLLNDTVGGLDDLERALYIVPEPNKQLDIRAQLAALCIRNGEYSKGITFLKPAIEDKTATLKMQADYILALRLDGDPQTAIKEGTRLWPEPAIIPSYGVQALADAYLRASQPKPAIRLYNLLLARNEEDINKRDILAGLAYATIFDGNVAQGKQLYTSLLDSYPDLASIAIGDASALFDQGRYWSGKELFKLVIAKFPDNRQFRQQFAAQLASKDMPREAAAEYAALAKLPNSQPVAGAGLTVNSLPTGDYSAARLGVNQLNDQPLRNPMVAQAVKKFDERPQGSIDVNANAQRDYKGNDIKEIQFSGEQRLGDRLTATISTDTKILAKDGFSARYSMLGPGLRYQDLQQEAEAAWTLYSGGIKTNAYHMQYSRFLGDQINWSLALDRLPMDDPQAVQLGIMQSNQRFSFNRMLNSANSYSLGVTRAAFSDGNQTLGYDGLWTHTYYDKQNVYRGWFGYFSRNSFKFQTINDLPTVYESPSLREFYGFAVRQRWTMNKAYWENTFYFEWNRDHPEKFSFSPHTRLEYGYRFIPDQQLALGVEYGLHTVSDGGGLWFDYRRYDLDYRYNW
jgi:tetratricopeptide (TPR) repeat protein